MEQEEPRSTILLRQILKQKEILSIAETMPVDRINEVIFHLQKLIKEKKQRKNKLQQTMLSARKDIHPVCKV